jgi:SAM-dependent methyltransferase
MFSEYQENLKKYLYVCSGKDVLEIGPLDGRATTVIDFFNPKSVTLVEPNPTSLKILNDKFINHQIFGEDVYHYLESTKKFDVVVCNGVLYHLHSPMYLLELIVNRTDPDILIIESIFLDNVKTTGALFGEEIDNIQGNRQVLNNWKSTGIRLMFTSSLLKLAMKNLGFELVKEEEFDLSSKKKSNIFMFKKI